MRCPDTVFNGSVVAGRETHDESNDAAPIIRKITVPRAMGCCDGGCMGLIELPHLSLSLGGRPASDIGRLSGAGPGRKKKRRAGTGPPLAVSNKRAQALAQV